MKLRNVLASAAIAVASMAAASSASATLVYVGSWEVDHGPNVGTDPIAYSGQAVAALLFGGNASSYTISSLSADPATANGYAWVSVYDGNDGTGDPPCLGLQCGAQVPEDFVQSTDGHYAEHGDTSAYVFDDAQGPHYMNYAFIYVPEPATWAVMLAGFAIVGFGLRRRSASTDRRLVSA